MTGSAGRWRIRHRCILWKTHFKEGGIGFLPSLLSRHEGISEFLVFLSLPDLFEWLVENVPKAHVRGGVFSVAEDPREGR